MGVLGLNPVSRDVGGVRGQVSEGNFDDVRPKRQGRADFTRIHLPTLPGAPVEREEGKGGCEINLSQLSGLETQYESVGKQRN